MGYTRTEYVIIGYKIPYDLIGDDNEEFLPYIEGSPNVDVTIIKDDMSGDFAIFGKVLLSSDRDNGFEFTEIEITDDDKRIVNNEFKKLFPDYKLTDEIKIIGFSHYV